MHIPYDGISEEEGRQEKDCLREGMEEEERV